MGAFTRRLKLRPHAARKPDVPPAPPGTSYPGSYDQLFSTLGLTPGANVVVPAGQNWLLDMDTPQLGSLTVAGNLWVDTTKSTSITMLYGNVTSTGKYQCGTPVARLSQLYTHVIECNNAEQGKAVAYSTQMTGASGSTSTGLIKFIWQGAGIDRAETYTVTFTSATAFSVSGSSSGALGTGTVGTAFDNKIFFLATGTFATGNTRTLTSIAKAFNNTGLTSRGFMVDDGGSIKLYGALKTHRLRAQGSAGVNTLAAGSTTIPTNIIPSNWKNGDEIVIGTTEHYQWGLNGTDIAACDLRTLTGDISTASLGISSGLSRARCCAIQYINEGALDAYGRRTGSMSYTNTGYTTHQPNTPTTVDQRAWVINLTRNIKFQGPDDAAWQNSAAGRFGAHMMIMGRTDDKIQLDSVEFKRCGQRGRIGRYPIHFHMNSYEMPYGTGKPSNGVSKGAMTGTYIRNCSINLSAQHGVQLHGVHGVEVKDTVTYGVAGHAFNLEDGSERRNIFNGCVAMETGSIGNSTTLQTRFHEADAAGYWLTNPDNDCYDCVSVKGVMGFWLSPAEACWGLSRDVPLVPSRIRHGILQDNYAICHSKNGAITGHIVSDEQGTVIDGSGYYWPTDTDAVGGTTVIFRLKRYQLYKSFGDSYANRGGYPRYENFTVADGGRTDFSGSITMGILVDSLIVNTSANRTNFAKYSVVWTTPPTRRGMASYHYTLAPQGCVFIGFGATFPTANPATNGGLFNPNGKISGVEATGSAIGSDDLYMKAVEMGYITVTNNRFLSSVVSAFSRSWDFRVKWTGESVANQSTSIAGAKWDPNGILTGTAGRYVVYNDPMYTYGVTTYSLPDDPYSVAVDASVLPYGIKIYNNDRDSAAFNTTAVGVNSARLASYDCSRLDASNNVVGTWHYDKRDNVSLGKDKMFVPMVKNAVVRVDLQNDTVDRRPRIDANIFVDNANRVDDTFILGISWNGANANPRVFIVAQEQTNVRDVSQAELDGGYARNFSNAGQTSLATLRASGGNTFWYDTTNKIIWIKYLGGLTRPETMANPEQSFNEWQYQQSNTIMIRNT